MPDLIYACISTGHAMQIHGRVALGSKRLLLSGLAIRNATAHFVTRLFFSSHHGPPVFLLAVVPLQCRRTVAPASCKSC